MDKPKIVLTCGTKFHSDHVSYQLQKRGLLLRSVTAHPAGKYLNRVPLDRKKIIFIIPLFVIPYFLKKLPLFGAYLAKLIEYRLPPLFDYIASKFLTGATTSISWSWASLYTIKKIKSQGGIAILEESGSCNLYQNELLAEEYETLKLKFKTRTPDFITGRELIEANVADYILCPSLYVASSFIKQGISEEKFHIIPYGVNLDNFTCLNIEPEEFTILFVGTIGVRKGLIYLFKALELLQYELPIKCILVGPVEDEFKIIFETFRHLFIYAGRLPQTELVQYYNKASVFVFPSLDEGMALVQMEAMACGLPVITTLHAGSDGVIANTIEGFIVPIRDPKAIADKIRLLYSDVKLRKKMSAAAQKKALEFSWDNYGEKLQQFVYAIQKKQALDPYNRIVTTKS